MENIDRAVNYTELKLTTCGREICIKDKGIVLQSSPYFILHYVVAGKGSLRIEGKTYHLVPGMMFLIPVGTVVQYAPDRDEPWTYEWIGFDGSVAGKYLEEIELNATNPIYDDTQTKSLKRYFDKIFNEYVEAGHLNVTTLGLAYQLFGQMITKKESQNQHNNSREMLIVLAKEYMNNNYQFEVKIDDVAKNVGVTPNYLANVFSDMGESSPKRYMTKIRMEKAKTLLANRKYKVKDVGMLVGYKHQLHFSAEFKKYVGVSPAIYAEQIRLGKN